MIRIQPSASKPSLLGLGLIVQSGPATCPSGESRTCDAYGNCRCVKQLSGAGAALVLGGLGLFVVAIVGLKFYQYSKGIPDAPHYDYGHHGHHHGGGLHLEFS